MFFKNDYEVFALDHSQDGIVRVDVRLTESQPTMLMALIALREKIDVHIFNERMRLKELSCEADAEITEELL